MMATINLYSKEQIDEKQIGTPEDTASASGSLWARIKNALSRIGILETADGQNVKLTGNQSISGTKTFNASPVVPTTPATTSSAINSAYANDATDGVNNIVHKSGNEKISGLKTFNNEFVLINNGGRLGRFRVDSNFDITDLSTVTDNKFGMLCLRDKNNVDCGYMSILIQPNGLGKIQLNAHAIGNTALAQLELVINSNGTAELILYKTVNGITTSSTLATL